MGEFLKSNVNNSVPITESVVISNKEEHVDKAYTDAIPSRVPHTIKL